MTLAKYHELKYISMLIMLLSLSVTLRHLLLHKDQLDALKPLYRKLCIIVQTTSIFLVQDFCVNWF